MTTTNVRSGGISPAGAFSERTRETRCWACQFGYDIQKEGDRRWVCQACICKNVLHPRHFEAGGIHNGYNHLFNDHGIRAPPGRTKGTAERKANSKSRKPTGQQTLVESIKLDLHDPQEQAIANGFIKRFDKEHFRRLLLLLLYQGLLLSTDDRRLFEFEYRQYQNKYKEWDRQEKELESLSAYFNETGNLHARSEPAEQEKSSRLVGDRRVQGETVKEFKGQEALLEIRHNGRQGAARVDTSTESRDAVRGQSGAGGPNSCDRLTPVEATVNDLSRSVEGVEGRGGIRRKDGLGTLDNDDTVEEAGIGSRVGEVNASNQGLGNDVGKDTERGELLGELGSLSHGGRVVGGCKNTDAETPDSWQRVAEDGNEGRDEVGVVSCDLRRHCDTYKDLGYTDGEIVADIVDLGDEVLLDDIGGEARHLEPQSVDQNLLLRRSKRAPDHIRLHVEVVESGRHHASQHTLHGAVRCYEETITSCLVRLHREVAAQSVGFIRGNIGVDVALSIPVTVVIIWDAIPRAVGWRLVEVGTVKPVKLSVHVRVETGLENRVVTEVDAANHVGGQERYLFSLGKVVEWVLVQRHLAKLCDGYHLGRENLGIVKQVETICELIGFIHNLDAKLPLWVYASLNGVEQVLTVRVRVLAPRCLCLLPEVQGLTLHGSPCVSDELA
ncbi:phenol 2-monooxygenase [Ilyonectria robusta]